MGVKLGTDNNWAIKDGNLLAYNDASGRFFNKEFDFARGSRATYVGRDGLIKNSGEQPTNLVQNGDFSQLGSELVTNGDFATDSDWAKGTGWTISGGTANCDGTNSPIDQYSVTTVGKTYKVDITVINMTTASINIRLGTSSLDIIGSVYANGTYTFYGTVLSDTTFRIRSADGFDGSIDNVSVKQVDPNDEWTLGTGWSIGEDKAISDGSQTSVSFLFQNGIVQSGKIYKVTYDVVSYTSGEIIAFIGGSQGQARTSVGTYTEYLSTINTNFWLRADANFVGSVSNISVQEIDTNTPRIDFTDDVNGHLLLEPQRTNLLLQSNQFDTTWALSGTTLTSGQIGVGGSSDAWLLEKNGLSFNHINQNISLSGVKTTSIYAKAGTLGGVRILNLGGGNSTAYFNLNNGTVFNINPITTDAKIESVGNGWYRCSITDNEIITQARIYPVTDDGQFYENGNIYIQYAQLEANASYATSYIPTYGSVQTRLGESCNNSGSAQDFNSEEGVLYAEISALANDLTNRFISISDGTSGNYISLYYSTVSNRLKTACYDGTNIIAFFQDNFTITDNLKIALKYKTNDFSLWVNGIEVNTSVINWAIPANTLDRLNFSHYSGSLPFYGKTKQIQVFTTALTDAELIALTTI